eukprot:TRINITY_DN4729_c0_g1_i1.p1 TRINITY_DN4729_c0_g1~~TRINITY_DN4729_c0_g1_i1.p1  ORF type:complete len:388 (+),score=97.25 TRINITY_DN4729_c0_g1_i1:39-1202(+)
MKQTRGRRRGNETSTAGAADEVGEDSEYAHVVDGSQLEGGGQVLRISFALASLLGAPLKVSRVRAGRAKPGLQAQHLCGIELLARLYGAKLTGGRMQSCCVGYRPHAFTLTSYNNTATADTKTAGSVGLLIQVSLPCLVFAPCSCSLLLKGGTNAGMAPTVDYLNQIFAPVAQRMGFSLELTIVRRGYYPRGGGEVHLNVTKPLAPGKCLLPITLLDRGELTSLRCDAYVSCLPLHVAERECEAAKGVLEGVAHIPAVCCAAHDVSAESNGIGNWVQVTAVTSTGCVFGCTAIGERRITAEEVGKKAAEEMVETLAEGGCVDEYLQDQLLVFMALAKGVSRVRVGTISLHSQTAMAVSTQLAGARFNVERISECCNIITCEGTGFHM